jgi:hypothetical protein
VTPEERVRKAFEPWDDVVMGDPGGYGPGEADVLALVRAAVAEEREACAKIALACDFTRELAGDIPGVIANAILSRGEA